jgi:hypothetical protein
LYKALSKQFKGKLIFGEIRSDETELINRFKVETFPFIVVITDVLTLKYEVYTDILKYDNLFKFLAGFAT